MANTLDSFVSDIDCGRVKCFFRVELVATVLVALTSESFVSSLIPIEVHLVVLIGSKQSVVLPFFTPKVFFATPSFSRKLKGPS